MCKLIVLITCIIIAVASSQPAIIIGENDTDALITGVLNDIKIGLNSIKFLFQSISDTEMKIETILTSFGLQVTSLISNILKHRDPLVIKYIDLETFGLKPELFNFTASGISNLTMKNVTISGVFDEYVTFPWTFPHIQIYSNYTFDESENVTKNGDFNITFNMLQLNMTCDLLFLVGFPFGTPTGCVFAYDLGTDPQFSITGPFDEMQLTQLFEDWIEKVGWRKMISDLASDFVAKIQNIVLNFKK